MRGDIGPVDCNRVLKVVVDLCVTGWKGEEDGGRERQEEREKGEE